MKLLFFIILLALSGISSFAQQAIGNRPPQAFGPVKTITYKYHSVTFSRDKTRIDEGVSNGRNVVWLFNAEGKPLTSEIFEKDGRPSGTKSLFTYDNAKLTSIIHYLLGLLSYTETFTYPAERRVEIKRVFEAQPIGSIEIESDEYDKAGRITKATFQDEEGTHTELYKYDDKGNTTEFVHNDGSGKQLIKETYQYKFDWNGNWTERRSNVLAAPHLGIPPTTTTKRKLTYY